jgi:hypothetical protein
MRNIPEQLYVAVAELLAWLYSLETGSRAGWRSMPRQRDGELGAVKTTIFRTAITLSPVYTVSVMGALTTMSSPGEKPCC